MPCDQRLEFPHLRPGYHRTHFCRVKFNSIKVRGKLEIEFHTAEIQRRNGALLLTKLSSRQHPKIANRHQELNNKNKQTNKIVWSGCWYLRLKAV